MGEEEEVVISEQDEVLIKKMDEYGIERIGGCHRCQPNGGWAGGWGPIPDEVRQEIIDSCCEDADGRKNYPTFCKIEEEF